MSNLGVHADANFEYGDMYWRLAQLNGRMAAITMILNPNALGKAAPAIMAADRQVLRFYNVEENMKGSDNGGSTPAQNVERAAAAMGPAFSMYPDARWAYFRNELSDLSKADFYAEEMRLWVEELAVRNAYAAIGCFSFGMPDYPYWPRFDKALAAANANGGYLALHEYGVLTMKSAYDPAKGWGHHCLRYREVWRQNNYAKRFPNLRIAVTETGLDRDVNTNVGDGWRAIGLAPARYLEELAWYDSEISKDGVTATVYAWTSDRDWWAFDINGPAADGLLARIGSGYPILEAQEPPIVIPPDEPPPTPEPEPEPATVLIYENRFDTFEPRLFADGMGDIMIPPGFEVGYKSDGNYQNLHGELSPSRETGVQKPDCFSFHVQGKMNAWLRYEFATVPGETYRVSVETDASADGVTRYVMLDPLAGTSNAALDKTGTNAVGRMWVSKDMKATGTKMAAYWQALANSTIRKDARIYAFKVERVKVTEPEPEPPATFPAGEYQVVGVDGYLRVRSTPNAVDPPTNEIGRLPLGLRFEVEGGANGWAKVKGLTGYVSTTYIKGV